MSCTWWGSQYFKRGKYNNELLTVQTKKMLAWTKYSANGHSPAMSSLPCTQRMEAKSVAASSGTSTKSCLRKTSSSSRRENKKVVRFSEIASMRYTISLYDYNPKEIRNTWYSDEEQTQIMESRSKEIRKLNQGKELLDKKYCSRGLENFIDTKSKLRLLTKSCAINAVVYAQEISQLGDDDVMMTRMGFADIDEYIAEKYQVFTKHAQLEAYSRGLHDEKVVVASSTKGLGRRKNNCRPPPPVAPHEAVARSA